MSNSRLNTLKLAQEVYKNVSRLPLWEPFEPMPGCDCEDCSDRGLMELLRIFQNDLYMFAGEKRFALYNQSPVVAGYQLTRILARATNLGTSFCKISQYVGVILHLYNLLRQLRLIDEETFCWSISTVSLAAPYIETLFLPSGSTLIMRLSKDLLRKTQSHQKRD